MRESIKVGGRLQYEGCVTFKGHGYYCGLHDTKSLCRRAEARMKRELQSGKRKPKVKVVKVDKDFDVDVQSLLSRSWEL